MVSHTVIVANRSPCIHWLHTVGSYVSPNCSHWWWWYLVAYQYIYMYVLLTIIISDSEDSSAVWWSSHSSQIKKTNGRLLYHCTDEYGLRQLHIRIISNVQGFCQCQWTYWSGREGNWTTQMLQVVQTCWGMKSSPSLAQHHTNATPVDYGDVQLHAEYTQFNTLTFKLESSPKILVLHICLYTKPALHQS